MLCMYVWVAMLRFDCGPSCLSLSLGAFSSVGRVFTPMLIAKVVPWFKKCICCATSVYVVKTWVVVVLPLHTWIPWDR